MKNSKKLRIRASVNHKRHQPLLPRVLVKHYQSLDIQMGNWRPLECKIRLQTLDYTVKLQLELLPEGWELDYPPVPKGTSL